MISRMLAIPGACRDLRHIAADYGITVPRGLWRKPQARRELWYALDCPPHTTISTDTRGRLLWCK